MAGSSSWAAEYLRLHPVLLDELLDARLLEVAPDWPAFRTQLDAQLDAAEPDTERQMDLMREAHHAQVFRLLAQDTAGLLTVERLADHLSALADLMLDLAIKFAWRKLLKKHREVPRFAIVSYGKLGGKELGYASDLDMVFLYDDPAPEAPETYSKLATRLNTWLSSQTAAKPKHEFFRGEGFAMAGASEIHNSIVGSIYAALYPQVRKNGCKIHQTDMRLKVLTTGLFTYPDLAVYCGDLIFTGDKPDTLTNPTLIIEVLSPFKKSHDKEIKLRHYRQIPSLQEYVLVAQDEAYIERYIRQNEGWLYVDVEGLDKRINFPSINASLALSNAYEQVNFGEETNT